MNLNLFIHLIPKILFKFQVGISFYSKNADAQLPLQHITEVVENLLQGRAVVSYILSPLSIVHK